MEIQVRTKLQDTWAQISEKLGDIWGRGLRYGEGPDLPDTPVQLGSATTRREVVEQLAVFAEAIHAAETAEVLLSQAREEMLGPDSAVPDEIRQRLAALMPRFAEAKSLLQGALDKLLQEISKLEGAQ